MYPGEPAVIQDSAIQIAGPQQDEALMSEWMCQSVSGNEHGPDRVGRLAVGGVPAELSSVLTDCSGLFPGADSLVMNKCQTILRSESRL